MSQITTSRRSFLQTSAAISGGLVLGFTLPGTRGQAMAAGISHEVNAWVHIATDNTITLLSHFSEMGQGVYTSMPMLIAEELNVDLKQVKVASAPPKAVYVNSLLGAQITGGSCSVRDAWTKLRIAGAQVREMLITAAAARWNVDASTLSTRAGTVLGPDGRKAGYGELAQAAMALPVPEKVRLKDPKDFRLIGRATGRLDARAKSSGRQDFGIDVRLPGLLTAVVARPPVFGAKLASVDDSAARAIPGVKAVLRVPLDRGAEGVVVVADGYWPAKQGREALKLQWDTSKVEKVDSTQLLAQYRALADQPGPRAFDADMAPLATAPHTIEAEFTFPFLAHAPMEPLNCTVQLSATGAELWVGSQSPGLDGAAAAKALGISPAQVKVNVQMAGGGFGRRLVSTNEYVIEACEVAKAVRTAGLNGPVKTLWSREDDIKGGYYRPMHLHRARIGFDKQGNVLAWDHVLVGQSILTGSVFEAYQVKNGIDATATEGMREPYPFPMRLTVHHPKVNVPVLWWRSVGSTHTAYVMETLLDDIARATQQDPVAYRMRLFGDKHPRHRAALQLAVDKSGYGKKKLPAGRAWGIAVHESFSSVVAYVVEASVKDGQPVLHRVTSGVHCNLAVNPRSIEAQVQGAAIMGLSMCLPGSGITLKDGLVEQSNFGDYTVARMPDAPAFEVHIVPSADAPTGMGEPGLPPLAPAFANAIAQLTGKPLRALPFKLA